jgi:hypothetical protein
MDMKMRECYADDDLSPLDTQASTHNVLPKLILLSSKSLPKCGWALEVYLQKYN